ncbi:MAG TPA: hypothetical protein VK700_06740, partial [Steroidobacteraceae bacterium]|nr:hypothetical protein [Steroidobacteraceae bacterium]
MKKELHLTRLDTLADTYEGTLPLQTRDTTLAELRRTITSEKAWPMVEKAVHFARQFRTPETTKDFMARYMGATPEGASDNFSATFGIFTIFAMVQLMRIGAAAALAKLEASG